MRGINPPLFVFMKNPTIAAIATALDNSSIAIIRVSGDEAIDIVSKIFITPSGKLLSDCKSGTINYGHIVNKGDVIDEVYVSIFRAPNSYTRENVVEINTHGGIYVTKKVLAILLQNGCRLAMPGEFSKRAFLNGRIDLSQAEAVMELINSENDLSLRSGISKLSGSVYKKIKKIRDEIIYEIAHIESALDDPEHINLDNYSEIIRNKIDNTIIDLQRLSDSAETGRIIRNGIKTVIVGKPNVGKSSVMNVLLGEDRAIVTDIEGTTRDSIEEGLKLGNINLRLIDTAGIRNSEDIIENIGIEKSISLCNDADLILFVIDSSRKLDDNDIKIIEMTENKKMIILLNKTDKEMVVSEADIDKLMSQRGSESSSYYIIPVSAKENIGFDKLSDAAESMFIDTAVINSNEVIITNLRHKANIDDAIMSLKSVINSIELGMPEDFYTIDMMGAYTSLGYIIGEEVDDDLVNEIFSKFCMGK